eukprot:512209-Heterocapsa_arctica.AAC.1
MEARRVHRLRDEVLRPVRSAHRRKTLYADLRLKLRGSVQEELPYLARKVCHAVAGADHVVSAEELADGDRRVAELDLLSCHYHRAASSAAGAAIISSAT